LVKATIFLNATIAVAMGLPAACKSVPPAAEVRQSVAERRVVGRSVDGVPFVEQEPLGCGPAALSAVMAYHGVNVTPADIHSGELMPSSVGSATYELALAARARGLFARDIRFPCKEDSSPMRRLIALVDEGIPVIVLVRTGFPMFRSYHYEAIVGYDDTNGYVLYQDGYTPDGVDTYASFQDDWHDGDHWALVVFPPEKELSFLTAEDRIELGALCEEKGSWEAAERHYRIARVEKLEDRRAALGLASALSHLGRRDEAAAVFEEMLRSQPDDPRALNNYALHLLRNNIDLARAEALARRARAASPDLAAFIDDTIGQILAARGETERARSAFESALAAAKPNQKKLQDKIRERIAALETGTAQVSH
jgi:tetratricopeptide (TPR) repeat protein